MPDPIFFESVANPTLAVPPIAHAEHHWVEESRTLFYEYNGRPIIEMIVPDDCGEFGFRHSSDGDVQSWPYLQQLYFMLDKPAKVTVHFHLSPEAVSMRPNRAGSEQAIVGQSGFPLIYGVNGLYDIKQDFLMDWHGRDWKWLDTELTPNENGDLIAHLEVELGPKPWFMNLRPHFYRTHLGYTYHEPWRFRPYPNPVTGWCSWEAYRRDVSEENVTAAAEFFKPLKPYGMEFIQIDDGYELTPIPADPTQSIAVSWLNTNAQFPGGHDAVINKIKDAGLVPGIWTSCTLNNDDFAKYQPECIVHDKDGNPVQGDWLGFVLNCEPATLEKHVHPYYSGLRDKGYLYFKTDQIRHLLYDGLQKSAKMGILTNEDVELRFRAWMEAARKAVGDDAFYLASWGVLSQVVGVADACRIGIDANPTWAGVRMQLVESARWFHAQRILFINDPDHVCVRAKFEWTRTLLSLVSLSGGLFMLSDPLDVYDEPRLELVKKTIPPLVTTTAETGALDLSYPAYTWTKLHGFAVPREIPVQAEGVELEDAMNMAGNYATMNDDHPFTSLWTIHINKPWANWSVVGRFATVPLKASTVALENFGVDPTKDYLAFDFWAEKFLGKVTGSIDCSALDLGHCQVISLRPVLERPQFVASTRHISMDAISVKGESWDQNALALELSGVPGTTETYWFHAPGGKAPSSVTAEGASVSHVADGDLVAVSVSFQSENSRLVVNW